MKDAYKYQRVLPHPSGCRYIDYILGSYFNFVNKKASVNLLKTKTLEDKQKF